MDATKEYQKLGDEHPEWQSLGDVCMRAAALVHMGDVAISIDIGDLVILADPLLYKVFYNLIDNSLRHGMTADRISITEEGTEEGVTIVLSDNGSGISLEDKPNLFREGFGKVHGLGLFLSQEILDITGITIVETGEPGMGARFELHVPAGSFRRQTTPR